MLDLVRCGEGQAIHQGVYDWSRAFVGIIVHNNEMCLKTTYFEPLEAL
jgi:hypothetical protein